MLKYIYEEDYDDGPQDFATRTIERWSLRAALTTNPALYTNIYIYAFAYRYEMSALKSLAAHKFSHRLREWWRIDDLPEFVDAIYGSTPSWDRGLRDIIAVEAAKHITAILADLGCTQMMKEKGDFTVNVLRCVHHNERREKSALQAETAEFKMAMERCERMAAEEAEALRIERHSKVGSLMGSVQMLADKWSHCRNTHCQRGFGASFQLDTKWNTVVVICKGCSLEHRYYRD